MKINDKSGFIDKTGKVVIPARFDHVFKFSEGLTSVDIGGKCGYINKEGREVIPLQFEVCMPFAGGLAYMTGESEDLPLLGFIDRTGKIVFKE